MDYATRKEQTDRWFDDDLLLLFRGNRKAIIEAVNPLIRDDEQLHKNVSDNQWYQAIKGAAVWEPLAHLLDELSSLSFDNPRPYCKPSKIPNEWEAFRKMALDYATNTWWFDVLKPECKPSAWQSQMSRDVTPRHWKQTRKVARKWRKRVVKCFDEWAYRVREQAVARDIMQYRIKDMMDAGEHDNVLFDEFFRLWMLRERHFEKRVFDPAKPSPSPFVFISDPDYSDRWIRKWWDEGAGEKCREEARAEFDEMLAAGFPDYRGPDEPAQESTLKQAEEGMGNHHNECWDALIEWELTFEWDDLSRRLLSNRRPVRVRVPYSIVPEGESAERREAKINLIAWRDKRLDNFEGSDEEFSKLFREQTLERQFEETKKTLPADFVIEDHKDRFGTIHFEGYHPFVWRWREWHPDMDLHINEVRRLALISGYKLEQDGEGGFVEPRNAPQPIEPNADSRDFMFEYTSD